MYIVWVYMINGYYFPVNKDVYLFIIVICSKCDGTLFDFHCIFHLTLYNEWPKFKDKFDMFKDNFFFT